MTSLGDSGSLWGMAGVIRESPPYRVRGRLYVVVGFGSGVWGLACAGGPFDGALDRGLLRAFAVASVEEDSGGVDLVVCGGVVASLRDVKERIHEGHEGSRRWLGRLPSGGNDGMRYSAQWKCPSRGEPVSICARSAARHCIIARPASAAL